MRPAEFPGRLASLLPHLGLIVSGGNTILLLLTDGPADPHGSPRRATTRPARRSDKGAKLLGLGYPGGPEIERLAPGGRADAFDFPRGIGRRGDLDFSFSGLKTSLRYRVQAMAEPQVRSALADLCASYQEAVVDALVAEDRGRPGTGRIPKRRPLRWRREQQEPAGGDRARLSAGGRAQFLAAEPRHTGDNAGMIGFAAWQDSQDAALHAGAGLAVDPSAYL